MVMSFDSFHWHTNIHACIPYSITEYLVFILLHSMMIKFNCRFIIDLMNISNTIFSNNGDLMFKHIFCLRLLFIDRAVQCSCCFCIAIQASILVHLFNIFKKCSTSTFTPRCHLKGVRNVLNGDKRHFSVLKKYEIEIFNKIL